MRPSPDTSWRRLVRGGSYLFQRHLLRRDHLVARADEFGLELECYAADVIGRHLFKRGAIERAMTAVVIERVLLEPADACFDIGANIGWYSLILDRIAPAGAAVFAFEPDPDNYRLLAANVRRNQAAKVQASPCGLGQRAGTATLFRYSHKNRGRHSMLGDAAGEPITVEVTTLDDFREAHAPGRPVGFVKIDVEGFELPVLRGGTRTLAAARAALVELSPARMAQAGHGFGEALALLRGSGLTPHRLRDGQLEQVPDQALAALEQTRSANLLWLRLDP